MRKFQAGNLDRKIKILQKTKTKDRSGQDLFTWSVFHQCSAHISPTTEDSGTEKNEDMGIKEISKMTFLVRHKAGLTSEMIIYYDFIAGDFSPIDFSTVDFETIRNKIYNIKSVYEPQNTRRQWLLIDTVYKG